MGQPDGNDLPASIARSYGFIGIGWHELGDLSWLHDESHENRARALLADQFAAAYGDSAPRLSMGVSALWIFLREMEAGDMVVMLESRNSLVHVGRVTGPAVLIPSEDVDCPYRRRRPVQWLGSLIRDALPQGSLAWRAVRPSLIPNFAERSISPISKRLHALGCSRAPGVKAHSSLSR